jgi:hypothetical protein
LNWPLVVARTGSDWPPPDCGCRATAVPAGKRLYQVEKLRTAPTSRLRIGRDHLHPNSRSSRPTYVSPVGTDLASRFGVNEKRLPRSLYNAQNIPFFSITSFSPAITINVDSSSTGRA